MKKFIFLGILFPTFISAQAPALPSGLTGQTEETSWNQEDDSDWDFNGFLDTRLGVRLQNQDFQKDISLAEIRAHLSAEYSGDSFTATFSGDLLYDDIERNDVALDAGSGWFDLREANLSFRPISFADVKIGRQVLTWGTGDM
ncbi:MAG: hypothetical protein ACTSXV_01600, partial [Alphaproteobacteria bacterium]